MHNEEGSVILKDSLTVKASVLLCWPMQLALGLLAVDLFLIPFGGGLIITQGMIVGIFYFIKYALAPVVLVTTCCDIFLYFYKKENKVMAWLSAANIVSLVWLAFGFWNIEESRIEELSLTTKEMEQRHEKDLKDARYEIALQWQSDRHRYMSDARDMLYYEMKSSDKKCKIVLNELKE